MSNNLRVGYSHALVELVKARDQSLVEVQFALHCIKNNVSAASAARWLGVSRATVYNWFKGDFTPTHEHKLAMGSILGVEEPV
jgi:predicted transcriptional regulator